MECVSSGACNWDGGDCGSGGGGSGSGGSGGSGSGGGCEDEATSGFSLSEYMVFACVWVVRARACVSVFAHIYIYTAFCQVRTHVALYTRRIRHTCSDRAACPRAHRCPCVCTHASIELLTHMSVRMCISMPIHVSIHRFANMSIRMSINMSMCMSMHMSTHSSTHKSIPMHGSTCSHTCSWAHHADLPVPMRLHTVIYMPAMTMNMPVHMPICVPIHMHIQTVVHMPINMHMHMRIRTLAY